MSSPVAVVGSATQTRSGPHGRNRHEADAIRPLLLAGFERSLPDASVPELEQLAGALSQDWLASRFREIPGTEEVALLGTCCRRELVALCRSEADVARWRSALPGSPGAWRARSGAEVVDHLFRVALGQQSLVVGEKEVREQVRAAATTVVSRHPRRLLKDLFEQAASSADALMPDVPSSRSIAAVAATRVLELCGRPFPRVLVVGAGAVGRQAAELLAPSARVTVAFRERPPDEGFLRATGARAVRAESLAAEAAVSDAVVTAAKTGVRCLGVEDLPTDRAIVVIDLGVPRNVEPRVRDQPNVRLLTLEELRPGATPPPAPTLDAALIERVEEFYAQVERTALEPWVAGVRRNAEEVRTDELKVARQFLGPLSPAQELAVDRLTRRLVERFLGPATDRIRRVPPGPEGDELRRFALELLRTDRPTP